MPIQREFRGPHVEYDYSTQANFIKEKTVIQEAVAWSCCVIVLQKYA